MFFPSTNEPRSQLGLSRDSQRQRLRGEDLPIQSTESSRIAFPEYQQLPKTIKSSIRQFLLERKSSFERRHEEVPARIWSLADATQEFDDEENYNGEASSEDGKYREEYDEAKGEEGPYGIILHTACAIGNSWLVELQIKDGVDVTAVDSHSWTALMIAKAQGHHACTELLSEYMETVADMPNPQPLPPSGLVKADLGTSIKIKADNLTAEYGSRRTYGLDRHVQIRSNHPILPDSPSFYYEVTILDSGPLGYVSSDLVDNPITF